MVGRFDLCHLVISQSSALRAKNTMNAKAKIIIGTASIEAEGSEEFVEKNLTWFKDHVKLAPSATLQPPGSAYPQPVRKPSFQEAQSSATASVKPKKSKSIQAERFDIHKGNGHQGLEEFISEKRPGEAAGNRIVVIAYFITEILKLPVFTEGHIEYAYKTLNLKKRPAHLRQIIINLKNDKDWFELDEETDGWRLTRNGEIFVSEKLPQEPEA
jgi:hypothetical protein